ncbi:MAG: radical SAM protein, partial [Prevotellaceae bacterium]|nr:radical SAM protein [Prevotellaceae bacterium]
MELNSIYNKILNSFPINKEEAIVLYTKAPTPVLMQMAMQIRYQLIPQQSVSWQIDRNVNISNVCISDCLFCNFHSKKHEYQKHFVTSLDEYREKIAEMRALGGNQLLLQGGLHPDFGIEFYENLFKSLKKETPDVRLHALGPPEIAHISKVSNLSYREVLERLVASGLDSLPGAGAEVLCDRVRKIISPAKPDTKSWIEVMRQAHLMGLITSAT